MDESRDFSIYSDKEIVDMYWDRNEDAISVTDGRYGKYLYKLAYNIIKEEDDSRSALNDTYLGAWNSMPPHRPEKLLLYLVKIARRISIDLFRRRNAKKRVSSELVCSLDELSECIASDADTERGVGGIAELLNAYLGTLEPKRRRMFVCRYYYSDSVEDIARVLSVGPSYVYRELAQMRRELAVALGKEGYNT